MDKASTTDMSWSRLRSILQTSRTLPEVDTSDAESDMMDVATIPINVEEAKLHEFPSESNLNLITDDKYGFLSVPANKLKRTTSLTLKPQLGNYRAQSLCSINSDFNSEGSLKVSHLSLSKGHRKSKPVREIFYREESNGDTSNDVFSGGIELSTLQQVTKLLFFVSNL